MAKKDFNFLTQKEQSLFGQLNTPVKIQNFINTIPNNFEKNGETCIAPRRVLREKKAHCIEGALFSATALWYHGRKPLVLHLSTTNEDQDHVVALFRENNFWGAISKSNHATLRYRDPVYETLRELVMSYFNEYYAYKGGKKTLRGCTKPINLKKFGIRWITDEKNLWKINDALFDAPHFPIAPQAILKTLRPVDPIEIKVGEITEWKKK